VKQNCFRSLICFKGNAGAGVAEADRNMDTGDGSTPALQICMIPKPGAASIHESTAEKQARQVSWLAASHPFFSSHPGQ